MSNTSHDPPYILQKSEEKFHGNVIAVRQDTLTLPTGQTLLRDVVEHYGAVAILALNEQGNLGLIQQYRHPIRKRAWEIPAGLLDGPNSETPLEAAQRELREEIGFGADQWAVLIDLHSSPGMTDEAVRIFLARQIYPVEQPELEEEEIGISLHWLSLSEALTLIQSGEITNSPAVAAILAYATFDPAHLRSPWEEFRDKPHALRERKGLL